MPDLYLQDGLGLAADPDHILEPEVGPRLGGDDGCSFSEVTLHRSAPPRWSHDGRGVSDATNYALAPLAR